jgi:hypothetical protein
VSQLKIRDFSGETLKVLSATMSATTTQLLSSGEFYKLPYVTIPVKSASANVFFYTNNSKIFSCYTLVANERHIDRPKHIVSFTDVLVT